MVKSWIVTAKDRTYKKKIVKLVKANTSEKAIKYAISEIQSDGYSNFQIVSCEEFSSWQQLHNKM